MGEFGEWTGEEGEEDMERVAEKLISALSEEERAVRRKKLEIGTWSNEMAEEEEKKEFNAPGLDGAGRDWGEGGAEEEAGDWNLEQRDGGGRGEERVQRSRPRWCWTRLGRGRCGGRSWRLELGATRWRRKRRRKSSTLPASMVLDETGERAVRRKKLEIGTWSNEMAEEEE